MPGTRVSPFGVQLRRLREAAGFSQEDLAERADLAAKAIGALERGERRRPYPRTVQMLADALQLDETQRRELIASVPRGLSAAPTESDEFIGRERELAELVVKLRAAASGRGGIVMLLGEAGIGKTRLAQELMTVARGHGAVVLSGRALEGEGQAPYGPWVEAIERYALTRDPDDLRREMGFDAPYIARLVPVVRSRLPDIERPEALSARDERLRLYGAVARFCCAISPQRPVLVFLDDLHWADRDTLGLTRYLAHTLTESRVLLVGAYRDPELGVDASHPLMTTLAALRREIACPTIRLRGFDRQEIVAFLTAAAGRPLAPALVELIGRETSGNPFYAREVLRHVAEAQPNTNGGDAAAAMTGVPEGVRQVVADRVERVSAQTARTLHDACGFTGEFSFLVLQKLTQLSEGELLDCLDEAVEAGLLRAPTAESREWDFSHAIVRHALYEGHTRDRRVRLHRRIAKALESAYRGQELDHAADIAVQYHASAELPDAGAGLRYALAAADQARAAFAHDRVVTLLQIACDLAGAAEAGVRIDIITRLALAEAESVRSVEACASAERALEVMAVSGAPARARAEFLLSVAQALKHSGAGTQLWEPLIDRGLGLLPGERNALWAKLTLLRDHYAEIRSGPIGSAIWMGQDQEAVAIARGSEDETDYATTLEALEWRTRAETDALYARIGTWSRPLARLKGLEVVVRDLVYKHGDFVPARRAAEELLAVAQRFGSVSSEAEALTQIANSFLSSGDFTAARARLADAERAIARLGPTHRLHLVPIGFAVGLGYYLETDWKSVAEAAEAYARTTDAHHTSVGLGAAAYAAIALARTDRPGDARAWLRDFAVASEQAHPMIYLQSWALSGAAAAAWEIAFSDVANTYRRLLLDVERVRAGPTVFGPIDLALARMTALVGANDDADELFERAMRYAEHVGHRPQQAIIAYDRARALVWSGAHDERISSLVTHAVSLFDALEMRSWAKRARSLPVDARRGSRASR
jgi:transcriptional regulator with XRE-family HTH domain